MVLNFVSRQILIGFIIICCRVMSGKLAPSKSTVYVGNLPYSLTNSDLHKVSRSIIKLILKILAFSDRN